MSGVESGLPAQFADVPVDVAAAAVTVSALSVYPEGTELCLRLGSSNLRHGDRVHHMSPWLGLLLSGLGAARDEFGGVRPRPGWGRPRGKIITVGRSVGHSQVLHVERQRIHGEAVRWHLERSRPRRWHRWRRLEIGAGYCFGDLRRLVAESVDLCRVLVYLGCCATWRHICDFILYFLLQ